MSLTEKRTLKTSKSTDHRKGITKKKEVEDERKEQAMHLKCEEGHEDKGQ